MASKVVIIPEHTIEVQIESPTVENPRGKMQTKNTFLHLLARVNELKKHKNDTDTILSHAIEEKLKALPDGAKTMDLEESEVDFISEGVKQLRSESGIAGPAWYYLVAPLRDAVDKKVYDRKKEK